MPQSQQRHDVEAAPGRRSLLELLHAVMVAADQENKRALRGLNNELMTILKKKHDYLSRRAGLHGADVDDARQEIALRLCQFVRRVNRVQPDNPEAYGRAIARNAVSGFARREWRRGRVHAATWLDDLPGPTLAPSYEAILGRVGRYAREYAKLAAHRARAGETAGQQVLAWYHLRVQRRPGSEVATRLGLAPSSASLVWKWAERGCRTVLDLAEHDTKGDRAALMLAIAKGREQPAAPAA